MEVFAWNNRQVREVREPIMCAAFIALAFALGGYLGLWTGRRQARKAYLEGFAIGQRELAAQR